MNLVMHDSMQSRKAALEERVFLTSSWLDYPGREERHRAARIGLWSLVTTLATVLLTTFTYLAHGAPRRVLFVAAVVVSLANLITVLRKVRMDAIHREWLAKKRAESATYSASSSD